MLTSASLGAPPSFLFIGCRCVCLVATERPPRDYLSYLAAVRAQTSAGSGLSVERSHDYKHLESIQVVDGFSDPLGWKCGSLATSVRWTAKHAAAERVPVAGASMSATASSVEDSSSSTRSTAAPTSYPIARLDDMTSLEGAVLKCLQRQTAEASSGIDESGHRGELADPGTVPRGSSLASIVVFDSVRAPSLLRLGFRVTCGLISTDHPVLHSGALPLQALPEKNPDPHPTHSTHPTVMSVLCCPRSASSAPLVPSFVAPPGTSWLRTWPHASCG